MWHDFEGSWYWLRLTKLSFHTKNFMLVSKDHFLRHNQSKYILSTDIIWVWSSVHPAFWATMGSVWCFGEHCKSGPDYVFLLLGRVHGTIIIQKIRFIHFVFTLGDFLMGPFPGMIIHMKGIIILFFIFLHYHLGFFYIEIAKYDTIYHPLLLSNLHFLF